MAKADKDGWIRHRGGKCPVEDGALVDVKHRNGDIFYAESALEGFAETWSHSRHRADIMAYRIYKPAEQPAPVSEPVERKCEGRACEMPDAESHSKECLLDAAIDQGWAGPLQWRDRIREIDRTVEALEEERVALVQRLEGEGLQLLQAKACGSAGERQADGDMSDWRNWKEGDIIQCLGNSGGYTDGKTYEVKSVNLDRAVVYTKLDDRRSKTNGWSCDFFKFHSRPSK